MEKHKNILSACDLSCDGSQLSFWDGLDTAIIGVSFRCGFDDVVTYDYDLCIEALVNSGMDYEEAVEYLEFNVIGAYIGNRTPLLMKRI